MWDFQTRFTILLFLVSQGAFKMHFRLLQVILDHVFFAAFSTFFELFPNYFINLFFKVAAS